MTTSTRAEPRVEAPLHKLRRLQQLRAQLQRLDRAERDRYRTDPAGWARDRLGIHLWSKQREVAESVVRNKRTTVRSAHATGKSFSASLLTLWWADVHPPGEALVVTSAPTYDQVHGIIWEEIRNHHRAADGKLPGRVLANDRWLLDDGREVAIGRKPPDHRQSAFQGWHRKYVLVILDEAGGVPAWLWDATEAITTGDHCRILAVGNPDDRSSFFYKTHTSDPGWNRIRIAAQDTPAFTGEPAPQVVLDGLVTPSWVADKVLRWGETNALYQAKVLGEFADAEDGLIPLHWVVAANRRWQNWQETAAASPVLVEPPGRRVFGVDVGWLGEDKTAVATRQGSIVLSVESHAKLDTTQTAGLITARLSHPQSLAVVDVVGVGAGVVDILGRAGHHVIPFNAGAHTRRRDSSGSWRFPRLRDAAWYNTRELLDPALDAQLALPPDDDLTADLTTPKYEPRSGGFLHVEPKDEIAKRLGHSPDKGDAVVIACWVETPGRDDHGPPPQPCIYEDSPSHPGEVVVDDWGDPDGWL